MIKYYEIDLLENVYRHNSRRYKACLFELKFQRLLKVKKRKKILGWRIKKMNRSKENKERERLETKYNLSSWNYLKSIKVDGEFDRIHIYCRGYFHDFQWFWDSKLFCSNFDGCGFSILKKTKADAVKSSIENLLKNLCDKNEITAEKKEKILATIDKCGLIES
jgi:hypothetical protein